MDQNEYDHLSRFANTEAQQKVLDAVREHGFRKAAEVNGWSRGTIGNTLTRIKAKAAKMGYAPEYDYRREVPDGFKLRGVSSYYNKDGDLAGQWVKSQADRERQLELMKEAIAAMAEEVQPVEATPAPHTEHNRHLMAAYPVGDHHLGMLAWNKETGADYDMHISENLLAKATSYLMGVPALQWANTGLIALLGDFFHYDSFEPVTPKNKNQLDSDTRYPKMVRAGIRMVMHMIKRALTQHAHVHVIVEIGNHDLSSSIFLMETLNVLYANEPRVSIDTSPAHFHYFRFGKVLIGTHHGDTVKMPQLPLIMATDRATDWGETEFRYWWTGHIHHSKTQAATSAQDYSGCSVESFQILAAPDAYAAQNGYRPTRSMKSILFHAEHGEIARYTFNPAIMES